MWLSSGDVVKCADKAKLVLVYANAREVAVAGGASHTVTAATSKLDKDAENRWQRLVKLMTPIGKNARYATQGTQASRNGPGETALELTAVQPREFDDEQGERLIGKALAKAPVFVFTRPQQNSTYRLRIEQLGEIIFDQVLTEAEMIPMAADSPIVIARPKFELPANVNLRWQVIVGNSANKQTRRMAFKSINLESTPAAREALRDLPTSAGPVSQLRRGVLLESEGFFGDAIVAYLTAIRLAPNEPVYHQMLARLYDSIESFQLADMEVEIAKRLSRKQETE